MSERQGIDRRYRVALAAGLAVVVALQAALFAWGADDTENDAADRPVAQLVDLPENDAPLEDVADVLTPEPASDPAPRRADVQTMAAIPSIPKLTAAMADAVEPLMFMETLEEPDAEENPAVSYATRSDFMVASADAQPLRPIDDRPASVLAAIGASRGVGIGMGGPHCKPQRPAMFTRSEVVSGAPSILRRVPGM